MSFFSSFSLSCFPFSGSCLVLSLPDRIFVALLAAREQCEPSTEKKDGGHLEVAPEDAEQPLDETMLAVLGDDPAATKAKRVDIHTTFLQRWRHGMLQGLSAADREEILNKYARPSEFEAPILNPEIAASLGEAACKRDAYKRETQQLAGSALTVLGAVLTMCNQEPQSIDRVEMLEYLLDVARFIMELHHKQTESRKAFITPGMSRDIKTILQTTVPGEFLFGEKLGDKIKEAKSLERMGHTLRLQPQVIQRSSTSSRPSLNSRGRWGTRPFPHTRAPTNTFEQARPRLFFRGRPRRSEDRGISQRTQKQSGSRTRSHSRYR